jgi:hypothetical protein
MQDTLMSNTPGSHCLVLGTVPVKFMNTYIDEPLDVALLEVEEDRCVVEVGQVGHVLATVVLRRVHLNKNKYSIHVKQSGGKRAFLCYQGTNETDPDKKSRIWILQGVLKPIAPNLKHRP